MGLDFDRLSAEELLAAESAILTMRSLMEAARDAPHDASAVRVVKILPSDSSSGHVPSLDESTLTVQCLHPHSRWNSENRRSKLFPQPFPPVGISHRSGTALLTNSR